MVAFGVIFVTLLALVYTVASGFGGIGFARQRQAANGLANELMEQARGVAYEQIQKGVDTANLTGDTNVVDDCSGVKRYQACTGAPPVGEEIVHSNRPDPANPNDPNDPNARVAPFDPHVVTGLKIGNTTLNRAVYVTRATNPDDAYRVIVRVTWDAPLRQGPKPLVETQTLIFSPEGCRSTVTHPFAAPCQPFLYGTAVVPSGSLAATGSAAGIPVAGTLLTAVARADAQDEQIARITAISTASALQLGDQAAAGQSVATAADNDVASSTLSAYDAKSTGPISSTSLTNSGTDHTFTVRYTANPGDSPTAESAAAAGGTDVCPTSPAPPDAETDSSPCGRSRVTQAGTLRTDLTLERGATPLGTATLYQAATAPNPTSAFVDRDSDDSPPNPGPVIAKADRSLGEIRLGGLLSGVDPPTGWNGYLIRLFGYSDTATASAGTGTSAPSATINGGTIEYWTGSGYQTMEVPSTTTTVPFTTLVATDTVGSTPVEITISGSIQAGGVVPSDPDAGSAECSATPDDCTRTSAQADVSPPLVGNLDYVVTSGELTPGARTQCPVDVNILCLANFDLVVNLGALSANATYQEAPSA